MKKADSYGTLLTKINLVCFFLLLIGGKHPGKITFSFSAAPVKGIPGPQPLFEGLSPKGIHGADTAEATCLQETPGRDTQALLFIKASSTLLVLTEVAHFPL